MKIKKILRMFIALALVISLVGCIKHVEDTNGEDNYEIETYTDEDITSGKYATLKVGSITSTVGNVTTLKVNKFTGIEELDSTKATNNTLVFNVESTITKGNFRMVIVKDGDIIRDVAINTTENITLENCSGRFKLIMVGESAKSI